MGGAQHDNAQHGRSGGGNKALKFHIKWSGRASGPAVEEQALARRAAGQPVAEQPAGRDAGIDGDVFQRKAVGNRSPVSQAPAVEMPNPRSAAMAFWVRCWLSRQRFKTRAKFARSPQGEFMRHF